MSRFLQYTHHGETVWALKDQVGKHREHCLCYSCDKFHPEDRTKNCVIADSVYSTCVENCIVTPVFECPEFEIGDFNELTRRIKRADVEKEYDVEHL